MTKPNSQACINAGRVPPRDQTVSSPSVKRKETVSLTTQVAADGRTTEGEAVILSCLPVIDGVTPMCADGII
jgi:hypothetical protein